MDMPISEIVERKVPIGKSRPFLKEITKRRPSSLRYMRWDPLPSRTKKNPNRRANLSTSEGVEGVGLTQLTRLVLLLLWGRPRPQLVYREDRRPLHLEHFG